MKILYVDIDYVLSLGSEITPVMTKWGYIHRFNKKAMKVFNEILDKTQSLYVISSDWKNHFTLEQLQDIFCEFADANYPPIDVTETISGVILQKLEEWRAKEILAHVEKYNPKSWVAIDDLDLSPWISEEHFVHLPRFMEGIKQTGKRNEIIKKLSTYEHK
jgi:hypothetical protein